MARSKEFDTAAVLRKSMAIFGRYGYEGTTLQQLLDGLGIARQSLYDTYGTKRDLFLSAVKQYVNEKSDAVVSTLAQAASPKDAIASVFREAANVLKDERRRNECFILQSAIDQIPLDDELAEFFRRDMERLERAFLDALRRAEALGEIRPGKPLTALARYLNHARYGLTQTAKLTTDSEALDQIVAITLSTLSPE